MSDDQKKPEGEQVHSPKDVAVESGIKAAARFVASTTGNQREFSELTEDDFLAFMNGVRAVANDAVRADFPALRAHTDKESRDGFSLGFIDREDGNKYIAGRDFKIGANKAPSKEQA